MSIDLYDLQRRLGGEVSAGGRQWLGPGPGHSPRDRSLSVTIGDDGRALVHSFAGDPFEACAAHVGLVRGQPKPSTRLESLSRTDHLQDAKAREIWSSAKLGGKVVAEYLKQRGITIPAPPSLRQGSAVILGRTPVPTMVAALQGADRRILAVQQTYLTWAGRKAPVTRPRNNVGKLCDGAVRLGPAGNVLGLAEGVETGLSAMQLFGIPTWCCLGAERMAKVTIPDHVRELNVFADADSPGQRAADCTAERWRRCGVDVKIRTPIDANDWNDVLRLQMEAA